MQIQYGQRWFDHVPLPFKTNTRRASTDLLTRLWVLSFALLKLYAITNCAQSRSTESLSTRFAVCPHTSCCVKSRWRLIRITPVDVSALGRIQSAQVNTVLPLLWRQNSISRLSLSGTVGSAIVNGRGQKDLPPCPACNNPFFFLQDQCRLSN